MGLTVLRALLILIAGAALGLAANTLSPRRIDWIAPPPPALSASETVSLQQARQLWDTGAAIFLDARAPADFEAGHIPNAFNLPADDFDADFGRVSPMLAPDTSIVCYCDGTECDLSRRLAELLRERGFTNVHILVNGWTSWHGAGYPASTRPQP